ncbi:MAG TPA: hypothetical protein VJQ26_06410 [Ktedonobacteraceae bacterium]|nr:hypothetical protein [Ktedonobacteraceae bacterium]
MSTILLPFKSQPGQGQVTAGQGQALSLLYTTARQAARCIVGVLLAGTLARLTIPLFKTARTGASPVPTIHDE